MGLYATSGVQSVKGPTQGASGEMDARSQGLIRI